MPEKISFMYYTLTLKYFHPQLKIALKNIKEAWLLTDINNPVKLKSIFYQGNLYYRIPLSGKRVSYNNLKKGLIKKTIRVKTPLSLLPS